MIMFLPNQITSTTGFSESKLKADERQNDRPNHLNTLFEFYKPWIIREKKIYPRIKKIAALTLFIYK